MTTVVTQWLPHATLAGLRTGVGGMTCIVVVVMDGQAHEAQGVAALGTPCKILKTFEVVRKKMGTNDPTAPPRRSCRLLGTHRYPRRPRLWLAMAADCQDKSAWKYNGKHDLFVFGLKSSNHCALSLSHSPIPSTPYVHPFLVLPLHLRFLSNSSRKMSGLCFSFRTGDGDYDGWGGLSIIFPFIFHLNS